ncbi:MAG: alpha/beta fold hydrolase [Bacteroidota bacterium]
MTRKQLLFKSLGFGLNAASFVSPDLAGRLTFRLFATPPKPNVRPKERAFLDTANRQDVVWECWQIPVFCWGKPGAPLVFCAYGWGYNSGRWRHYVPALVEAGYRVVAFDPPGHGLAPRGGTLDFPKLVRLERHLLRQFGGCELILAHSFGGGCLVEALAGLPRELHPKRVCLMGIFSEVKWIFIVFAEALGLRPVIFRELEKHIKKIEGRDLDDYDVARTATELEHIKALIIHDPQDQVTAFRNAQRNHSYWKGSALYAPEGAGHNLGTAGVTRRVLQWLIAGQLPEEATVNDGGLERLPAVVSAEDLAASGGVSDYYQ